MDNEIDFSRLPSSSQWQKIGARNHHGIALPLSAIRNPTSHGIGEFLDLIPLIHWVKSIGFDIIQLLPLNDSGYDPSPYSAHSAMALHPIYLSLSALPFIDPFLDELNEMRSCNTSKRVCYQKVLAAKEAFLERYAEHALPQVRLWAKYQEFFKESWLDDYAEYKVLKAKNQELPWWLWQDRAPPTEQELELHKFVQFLCFEQLTLVKEEAEKEKVFIKGDIPILLNRDSADVYKHPELFDLTYAAGAPPDIYSEEGQYWGFPLYNWQAMENEGFGWWKTRLQVAQQYYHLYRLDHIVGFFKIWAIPDGKKAKEGFFIPKDESLWIPQGEKILRMMLASSSMLPIGEDLGAVPTSVRECMRLLGIAGTKVMRWERYWDKARDFIKPKDYPLLSMSTISTHDSETFEMWWNESPLQAALFSDALQIPAHQPLDPETRMEVLLACHKSHSLFHINLLQEYLDLFDELAWANPEDDRINIPGKVLDRNWTYRFLPTLDEITHHEGLKAKMQELTK